MSLPELLFYLCSGVAVLAAIGVVTARNTVYGVLFLVLAFVATSVVWLLLETEFLALVLVLVYVGAVMTLFLFVVMMLNVKAVEEQKSFVRAWPLVLLILCVVIAAMIVATHMGQAGLAIASTWQPYPADYSNVADIGGVLYTVYFWPFEIAAIILLTAIVAAIALTHRRGGRGSLRQDPGKQSAVRRQDRIRIVKMKSEKSIRE